MVDTTLTPDSSVTLAWNAVAGAEHYTVYRAPAGEDDFAAVGSTSDTTFVDDTVDLGYTYEYAVTQTNGEGTESALSEPLTVSVTDPSVAPPATPTTAAPGGPSTAARPCTAVSACWRRCRRPLTV